MKTMMFPGRALAALSLLAGALATVITVSGPVRAANAANDDLSSRIYGNGKATLRWPGEDDNSASGYSGSYDSRYSSVFQGTVSRVRSRDYFDFRASDGHTYRVISDDDDGYFNVRAGERVEVRGSLTQGVIIASRVREIGSDYGYRQVDFPATVISVSSFSRLTVRGDNGRTYTIDARYRLPYNLSAGDYVRITGTWDGSTVNADQITVLREGYDGGGYGDRSVDFPGVVTSVDRYRDTLRVQGENGVTYTVTYTGADQFSTWDKVRVVGTFDGYSVRASAVYRRY